MKLLRLTTKGFRLLMFANAFVFLASVALLKLSTVSLTNAEAAKATIGQCIAVSTRTIGVVLREHPELYQKIRALPAIQVEP